MPEVAPLILTKFGHQPKLPGVPTVLMFVKEGPVIASMIRVEVVVV